MKTIKILSINSEHVVKVDDQDFWLFQKYMWHVTAGGYVYSSQLRKYLHRFINNTEQGFHTDHINRDKLDNRRENLRAVTASDNILNSKLSKNNKSGCNGVDYRVKASLWRARITKNRKEILIGHFATKEEAIDARKAVEASYGAMS